MGNAGNEGYWGYECIKGTLGHHPTLHCFIIYMVDLVCFISLYQISRESMCHVPNPLLGGDDRTNIYQPRKSKTHEHNIKMHELKYT